MQGCHGQGKNLEMKFFPGQGKVREFHGWSGKFGKSGGGGGGGVLSHEIVSAHLPRYWGLPLKERICSLGKQILSFKSNPQI